MNEFGAYRLAANPAMYEPQRENAFRFVVTGIDNILKAGADETDENAYITNAEEVLTFSVVSASVPHFTQDVITINRGNSVMKFAGKPTFNEGQLVVNDYIGANSKSALMAWQRLNYDVNNDAIGSAANYKKLCYLQEYTQDFTKLIRTWTLYGCFISGLTEGEFTAESGGKKTVTATIQFDKAVPEEF